MSDGEASPTPDRPTVYIVDEYEPRAFDAVLVQSDTVVCLRIDPDVVSVVPLDNVSRVDGPSELMRTGPQLPESFFGGGRYGLVDVDAFPSLRDHLEDIDRQRD